MLPSYLVKQDFEPEILRSIFNVTKSSRIISLYHLGFITPFPYYSWKLQQNSSKSRDGMGSLSHGSMGLLHEWLTSMVFYVGKHTGLVPWGIRNGYGKDPCPICFRDP